MKGKFLLIVFLGALNFYCRAQYRCTFELFAPSLDPKGSVFITGGHPALGNWQADAVPMKNVGNNLWTYSIELDNPKSIEYKYTLGDWQHSLGNDEGAAVGNLTVIVYNSISVRDTVLYWTSEKPAPQRESTIIGDLRRHLNMEYDGILPRNVYVWLPPGYEKKSKSKYSVLYMHDAQNLFDEATSSFGNEWGVDETLDSLIRIGSIPPMIVVGINNTRDRSDEYSEGKKGKLYMQFIVKKLKPFIDKNYRTLKDRKHTFVGGSSMGGLISFMLLWEYNNIFSKAICMSPAFKIQDINYVDNVAHNTKKRNMVAYFDNGGIGLEEDLQPGIDEMITTLRKKGYRDHKDFYFILDKTAKHSEGDWSNRLPEAIKLLSK